LFDTLRVFIIRIANGTSPFKGDRRHLHHLLLDMGFNHWQSSLILYGANLFFIGLVLLFQDLSQIYSIIIILTLAIGLSQWMVYLKNHRKANPAIDTKVVAMLQKTPKIMERELVSK
jgi:hypothetical protein